MKLLTYGKTLSSSNDHQEDPWRVKYNTQNKLAFIFYNTTEKFTTLFTQSVLSALANKAVVLNRKISRAAALYLTDETHGNNCNKDKLFL